MQVQGFHGIQAIMSIRKPDTGGSYKLDLRNGDNVRGLRMQQQTEDRSCDPYVKIWRVELVEAIS